MFEKIRAAIYGKKTYILGGIAIAIAVVAWASSEIAGAALVTAILAAFQTIFIRAAIKKAEFGTFDSVVDDDTEKDVGS